MNKKPLLSICIPTYNRCEYLKKAIESIINQEGFTNEVEVVISDNCSTDDTEAVSKSYCNKYPNIRYFRNEENVVDQNHPLALQRGNGYLRKLSNDTLLYKPGAIKTILDAIRTNMDDQPILFFLNSGKKDAVYECSTLDEFVKYISYNITWIGGNTFWENDCEELTDYMQDASSHIPQVFHLMKKAENRSAFVVYDSVLMTNLEVGKKNLSYGLFEVFHNNLLLSCLSAYVERGSISKDTYEEVRKDLLLDFFSGWVVRFQKHPEKYLLSDENLEELIRKEYSKERYYHIYKQRIAYCYFAETIWDIAKKLGLKRIGR